MHLTELTMQSDRLGTVYIGEGNGGLETLDDKASSTGAGTFEPRRRHGQESGNASLAMSMCDCLSTRALQRVGRRRRQHISGAGSACDFEHDCQCGSLRVMGRDQPQEEGTEGRNMLLSDTARRPAVPSWSRCAQLSTVGVLMTGPSPQFTQHRLCLRTSPSSRHSHRACPTPLLHSRGQ
jgi:hypothetical protein